MKFFNAALVITAISSLVAAADTCLPLTTGGTLPGKLNGLCSNPPGTTSSANVDVVCLLVSCCSNSNQITVELPDGTFFPCQSANCTSICDLSNQRAVLGNEACLSTCTPPPPPPPPDHSCLEDALNSLLQFIPWADAIPSGISCGKDLTGLSSTPSFELCYAKCSCSADGPACAAQNDACSAECGLENVPQDCVEFLDTVVWDILGPLGKLHNLVYLERLSQANSILSLFTDALKCLRSPNAV